MLRSTVFFPLRTNAHALLSGGPVASVVRRMKQASLLHDVVLLEAGTWSANAGPTGSTSFWVPPDKDGDHRWQHPWERRNAQESGFYLAMGPSGSSQPLRTVLQADSAEIVYRATFEPLREELHSSVDWIEYESFGLTRSGKRLAEEMGRSDANASWLAGELREEWSRRLLVKSVAHDLVLAGSLGVTVSIDNRHALATHARVARGDASLVLGERALEVLLPSVADMDWQDLARVRRDRGLKRIRSVLREIEAEARDSARTLSELDSSIRRRFVHELATAQSESAVSPSKLVPVLLGMVVGEVVTLAAAGLPVVGGAVGGAAGLIADGLKNRYGGGRWVRTFARVSSR